MITDRIKRRAFDAAAPFFSGDDHFDAVLAALEAVAPMLIAQGVREAMRMAYPLTPNAWSALYARAQELDPK